MLTADYRLSKNLPLTREVAKSKILTEGEIVEKVAFLHENVSNFQLSIPQSASLTAPFTQGSLCVVEINEFFDTLKSAVNNTAD